MRVIIPAAGEGKRFREAGYTLPKPLIPVDGTPMLERVLEMVECIDPCPLVVCNYRIASAVRTMCAEPIPIHYPQSGAALSVLCANGHLDDGEPVMVVDCDNIVATDSFQYWCQYAQQRAHDGAGGILAAQLPARGDHGTAWSYIMGTQGRVEKVLEKIPCSNLITLGCNMFPSWKKLRTAICRMVTAGDLISGEYYLAPAYNHLDAETGYCVIPFDDWKTFGTPEYLAQFKKGRV